jgi:energy-coupling factor transporter ATP-binding protein EcfA2
MSQSLIRVLADTPNARGDLFGRLLKDFAYALGYDNCRLNVQKAGREVDVTADHRFEERGLRVEAKATDAPIGGSDLNKFVGVLDAERTLANKPIAGYFVSLSGFTETAIQQELDLGGHRVVLVDANRLSEELAASTMLVSETEAAARAGYCAGKKDPALAIEGDPVLLAHELGWIWAFTFGRGKRASHFALVHADGTSLDRAIATQIAVADRAAGGSLHRLTYLPPDAATSQSANIRRLEVSYKQSVIATYGHVTLEGLPADEQVGSKRLALDRIYVATELERIGVADDDAGSSNTTESEALGRVLLAHRQVAILGPPGSGKSTLIKRIATMYATAEPDDLGDGLPAQDLVPFVLRCRQLDVASGDLSVVGLLSSLRLKSELVCGADDFDQMVHRCLRSGRAIVLIDGLDELNDAAVRIALTTQLRLFMSTYPAVGVVLTSREAGFRDVAPVLATACSKFRVADLSWDLIKQLTLAWHREVVGDSAEVATEARELAEVIWSTDRVRRLAVNPLLLTTLLLVRRWIGDLPKRRSVLYGKAIEVLLMTWNVEGHAPVDADEAIPQLAYLAYRMLEDGDAEVSLGRLSQILTDARRDLPEVLGFAKMTVVELVRRIEDRSSLLIQSGHVVEDGVLRPVYEFKHLTFQEYLAALAIVNDYAPSDGTGRRSEDRVRPHIHDIGWREVIPLVAVLCGAGAKDVTSLLAECAFLEFPEQSKADFERPTAHSLLRQCLIDEVQIAPDEARRSLNAIARTWPPGYEGHEVTQLLGGRFGDLVEPVVRSALDQPKGDLPSLMSFVTEYANATIGESASEIARTEAIMELVNSDDAFSRACGTQALMTVAWALSNEAHGKHRRRRVSGRRRALLLEGVDTCVTRVLVDKGALQYASMWALAWFGTSGIIDADRISGPLLRTLFKLWRTSRDEGVARIAAWALWSLPIVDPASRPLGELRGHAQFLKRQMQRSGRYSGDYEAAAIVSGLYFGGPWSLSELAVGAESASRFERYRSARVRVRQAIRAARESFAETQRP